MSSSKASARPRRSSSPRGARGAGRIKAAASGDSTPTGVGSFLYPGSQDGLQRGWRPEVGRDIARLVTQFRHRAMVSDGRYIYTSSGQVRGAVKEKADYTIGSAWRPVYLGTNKAFGDAFNALMARWTENCDLRGRPFSLARAAHIACKCFDTDGDFFILLTKNEAGEPRLQFLEAHRVGSPNGETLLPLDVRLPNGRTLRAGSIFLNGIVYDDYMRPLAYNLVQPDAALMPYSARVREQFQFLPAEAVIHGFDPEWYSQGRGIPSLIYGILDWYDLSEIREAEKIATKATARVALIETNESGRAGLPNAHLAAGSGVTSVDDIDTRNKVIANGLIRYFKANSNHKLEGFQPERPNRDLADFLDHIARSAHRGLGWPIDMHDMSKIGGAAVRSVMGQIQRSVAQRQDALWTPLLSAVLYATGAFVGNGTLPFAGDWWNLGFTLPAKPSVDIGRDSQNRRADVAMGLRSVSEIAEEDGITAEELMRRRARDWQLRDQIAAETGVPASAIFNPDAEVGQPIEPTVMMADPNA